MSLDEETLATAAREGELDYTKWPPMVEPLLERLNHIVYNDFAIPQPYSNVNRQQFAPSSPTQARTESAEDSSQTPTTQQPTTPVRQLPPVPLFPNSSATSTSHIPDSVPPSQTQPNSSLEKLPAVLVQLLNSILSTLRASFASKPPHTIQRLAELVLEPTRYYKTLPAWLRAVDRVVNVSSSADIFPLNDAPPLANGIVNGESGGGILWNNNDTRNGGEYDNDRLGSDESLGGALLTPIPWLRNGTASTEELDDTQDSRESDGDGLGQPIEMPSTSTEEGVAAAAALENTHHDPLVPERKDGAVTQGELMRMEQEAGVVPAHPSKPNSWEGDGEEGDEVDDLVPHARGPDVVGAVDMGKVDGQEMEVKIASPPESREHADVDPNDAQDVLQHDGNNASGEPMMQEDFEMVNKDDEMQLDEPEPKKSVPQDEDEDMVLVDADGKTEDEPKHGEQGEEVGPDAADASTIT